MAALFEIARPKQWSEVVGQEKALKVAQLLIARGLGGRAVWISGKSGQGKTTIARLLAEELADPDNVEELDASELTPARLKSIEDGGRCRAIGSKSGRAFIVNESHGLSKSAVRQLLVILERIPGHVLWIFTTTTSGQQLLLEGTEDGGPLLSRCNRIDLAQRDLAKPFAERARTIAAEHGLDGQPIERYLRLAKDCGNNLRAMFSAIESGAMLD